MSHHDDEHQRHHGGDHGGDAQPASNGSIIQASDSYVVPPEAINKEHKYKEHGYMAEMAALGAAAFAAYEAHEVKADPTHARRHRLEEAMAVAASVGLAGYAFHEHRKAKHEHRRSDGSVHSHGMHHRKGHRK